MIHWIHSLVWGPALLGLLLFTGLFFTVRSRAFQFRGLGIWWRSTVGSLFFKKESPGTAGDSRPVGSDGSHGGEIGSLGGRRRRPGQGTGKDSVSKLQSACTALAATIGTGNIVGVASALTAGGPGAVFWMWVSAALGMMTAYAETSLGIAFRYRDRAGRWICGPMVYLEQGLKSPVLSLAYGILCLLASLGMGSMVQSNAAAQTIQYLTGFNPVFCAAVITGLVVFVAWGGTRRVTGAAQGLVPLSAGIYIAFSAAVLVKYRSQVPRAFGEIFQYALLPRSALGGIGGYGISRSFRYGIARGVFSNEAGLGSLAGLHGATEDTTPEEQGMWAMFEVFFDTMVICTMTALVILCTVGGGRGLAAGSYDGAVLTARCFAAALGDAGEYLVSVSMVVFAFATMIAWYYLGRQTLGGVLDWIKARGRISQKTCRRAEALYLLLFGYAVFLGCVSNLRAVWELSDIWNGLMAFPNILAVLALGRQIRYPDSIP